MKIQKFNVDRMRRNVVRSTPDVIHKIFNATIENDSEARCSEWLEQFRLKMLVKHGKGWQIDVYTEDRFFQSPGEILVTAVARKVKK